MTRFRCHSCTGEYADLLPDESAYYHECPDVRLNPAGQPIPIANPRSELVLDPPRLPNGAPHPNRGKPRREGQGRTPI